MLRIYLSCAAAVVVAGISLMPMPAFAEVLTLDNGTMQVGVDRDKGASITWLSWRGQPNNAVNIADPGRLIQQSYYAGKSLDRKADGQHKAWSPWSWNPIQGGGVGSWARVTKLEKTADRLTSETIPKLWDMPNEEATAVMRQQTGFEPGMPNVVVVTCEFESQREEGDRWGPAVPRHQELPACYFTRSFSAIKSYLGDGRWRDESQPPGPPWGRASPPRKAMACFDARGQGIAVFSPVSNGPWNFGPHGRGDSADPQAGPCVHVAPIETVKLEPRAVLRYRYWLVVGTGSAIAVRLDALRERFSGEKITVGVLDDR